MLQFQMFGKQWLPDGHISQSIIQLLVNGQWFIYGTRSSVTWVPQLISFHNDAVLLNQLNRPVTAGAASRCHSRLHKSIVTLNPHRYPHHMARRCSRTRREKNCSWTRQRHDLERFLYIRLRVLLARSNPLRDWEVWHVFCVILSPLMRFYCI
jgi:hypothetical protein